MADEPVLPLSTIEAGLARHPPRLGDQTVRQPFVAALDAWVNRADTVYWTNVPRESNPDLFQYYILHMQKVLGEVATEKVRSGVVIWKLYSSGFLVKTPQTVFAIDVVEGPFKKIDRSPADVPDFLFQWTPKMRKRFAETVDVLFISHRHYDHTSFALVQAMLAEKKTVVAPRELKERFWKNHPFAKQITVLDHALVHKAGKLTVRVFAAVQAMKRDSQNQYLLSDSDPQHNVYLIRTQDGTTFLHNGDNRGVSFVPWLKEARAQGWNPDVWFKIMSWPRKLVQQVDSVTTPILSPGHEYGMGHKPKYGTNKLAHFFTGAHRRRMQAQRLVVMTWVPLLSVRLESQPFLPCR